MDPYSLQADWTEVSKCLVEERRQPRCCTRVYMVVEGY